MSEVRRSVHDNIILAGYGFDKLHLRGTHKWWLWNMLGVLHSFCF